MIFFSYLYLLKLYILVFIIIFTFFIFVKIIIIWVIQFILFKLYIFGSSRCLIGRGAFALFDVYRSLLHFPSLCKIWSLITSMCKIDDQRGVQVWYLVFNLPYVFDDFHFTASLLRNGPFNLFLIWSWLQNHDGSGSIVTCCRCQRRLWLNRWRWAQSAIGTLSSDS